MVYKAHDGDQKDTVLFIGSLRDGTIESFEEYNKTAKTKLHILLFIDQNKQNKARALKEKYLKTDVEVVPCNFRSTVRVRKVLKQYEERIVAVTAQTEEAIPEFQKIIPHVPYLNTPTVESLTWATDKILMRRMIDVHDTSLTPKFTIAEEASIEVIERVGKRIGYPVVVKPAGLAGSKLVSMCYHEDELQHVLKKTFRVLQRAYHRHNGRGEPQVIIERVMEGDMYSVDGYVDAKGKVTLVPPVHIKTGKEIGFDDFFGYRQLGPTLLSKESVDGAYHATVETVKALSLRSTSIHCELFKTEKGWKIIELGPRIGGYRHEIYKHSYGIDHIMNDVLVRIGQNLVVAKKRLGWAAYMKFYAKEEGVLVRLSGVNKVKKLDSCVSLEVEKQVGDELKYAKNGGGVVIKLFVSNPDRAGLLADIRRAEQALVIETNPTHVFRKQIQETADALLQPIEEVELMSKKAAKKVRDRVKEAFEDL